MSEQLERAANKMVIAAEANMQAVIIYAELQGMYAENMERSGRGMQIAYGKAAFDKVRDELAHQLGYLSERVRNA